MFAPVLSVPEPAAGGLRSKAEPASGGGEVTIELGALRLRIDRTGGVARAGRGAGDGVAVGDVILPGGPLRMFVATRPVDFRKGMDGLAALAQAELRLDPFTGAVLVFRAKRADRIKILIWDGTGLTLVGKRLDEGKFAWPPVSDGVMRLSAGQLGALFEGLDWRRVHARRVRRPTAAGSPATE